jgi:hypothetical protein
MLTWNQYCSESPLKILFQQHRSKAVRLRSSASFPVCPQQKPGERVKTNRRDALVWSSSCGLAISRRSGFPTRVTRRCVISPGRAKRRWRIYDASASRYRRFCCGKACTIRARGRGPTRELAGEPEVCIRRAARRLRGDAAGDAPGARAHRAAGVGDPGGNPGLVVGRGRDGTDGNAGHRFHFGHRISGGDRRSVTISERRAS